MKFRDRKRRHRKHLRLEELESRRLLAASPWTNPLDHLDSTGDGNVTSRDALVIINQLSPERKRDVETIAPPILGPTGTGDSFYYDSTGDRRITARDALLSINHLARNSPLAESFPQSDPRPTSNSATAPGNLSMSDGFARSSGTLKTADQRDTFRFVAESAHVAIDISSSAGDSITDSLVLDEFGAEVAKSSQLGHRSPSEGIKIPVTVGRTYQIVVELMPTQASSVGSATPLPYTLDVLQFDLMQWPGVTISNVHGYEWIEHLGPDSSLGDDIHDDDPSDATLIRPFRKRIQFESHIDDADDVDWFRVPVTNEAISFEARGQKESLRLGINVLDPDLNPIEPVTVTSHADTTESGTYPVGDTGEVLIGLQSVSGALGRYAFSLEDVQLDAAETASPTGR